jgi:hypothetical protein
MPAYFGGIRQWWDDWEEADESNPLMDPILGLYPFSAISVWEPNGNVTAMAQADLNHYLNETVGNSWSVVWYVPAYLLTIPCSSADIFCCCRPIAFSARLWNGTGAHAAIQRTMSDIEYSGATWLINGGTYQIDGNCKFKYASYTRCREFD